MRVLERVVAKLTDNSELIKMTRQLEESTANLADLSELVILTDRLAREEEKNREVLLALETERQQLIAIFEGIDQPIFVCHAETYELLYYNEALEHITETSATGQVCYELIYGLTTPCEDCLIDTNDVSGASHTCDRYSEVTHRWYHVIHKRIEWPNNPVHPAAFGMLVDITERKRAENLVLAQRDLSRALSVVSNLQEGLQLCVEGAIASADMDSGGIYLVDSLSGALRLAYYTGLSDAFIDSVRFYEADTDTAILVMKRSPIYATYEGLELPLSDIQKQEGLRATAIIPIMRGDTIIGCLNVASHTLNSIPEASQAGLETITADMGSALARLDAEEAYRAITEYSLQGLVIIDQERILFSNQAFVDMIGLPLEDLYKIPMDDWLARVHEDDLEGALLKREQYFTGKSAPIRYELRITIEDSIHWLEIFASSIEFRGKRAIQCAVQDVTDRHV